MADPNGDRPVGAATARYGRARALRSGHRWVAVAMAALGIAVAVALIVFAYRTFSTPDVKGDLGGYTVLDDETVSVTVTVTRSDPSRPAVCIVRARSMDGTETGRREVLIPPSTETIVSVTTTITTSKPPVLGDIYGCGTDVPGYLRSP